MPLTEFTLGMGSNLEDRAGNLENAVTSLVGSGMIFDVCLSPLFESDPAEGVEGGAFLNAVLRASTRMGLRHLVEICRKAECLAGSPTVKSGSARAVDIDILFFGGLKGVFEDTVLPHPRMAGRRFVLLPLCTVWQGVVPGLGATAAQLLDGCTGEGRVDIFRDAPPEGELRWR